MLLLERPQRVSVDIDIICTIPKEKFETSMREWVRHPPFTKWEQDTRESDKEPPTRRHYKLFYEARFGGLRSPYILLDVVEEECGIATEYTQTKDIDCSFLALEGTPSKVRVPQIDTILADKLTAFAPNTTGVHFNNPRLLEDSSHQVFKQLFDIAQLFDVMEDFAIVRNTYFLVVQKEAQYKAVKDVPVLRDTLQTAFDICTFDVRRKKFAPEYEKCISGGIAKMSSDLISGKTFSPADAKLAASKAAYLATLLLTDQPQIASFSMDKDVIAQLKAHQFPKQWGILVSERECRSLLVLVQNHGTSARAEKGIEISRSRLTIHDVDGNIFRHRFSFFRMVWLNGKNASKANIGK